MSKKKYDDELEDDSLNEDSTPEFIEEEAEPAEAPIDENLLISDDEEIDIVIEVSEGDEDISDSEEESPIEEEVVLSKHKIQGKHSLKYDSIFKGKKDDITDDDSTFFFNEKFEVDRSSIMYAESHDNEYYLRQKRVKERVYAVLSTKTTLNFLNNRRKPSRVDFNNYYLLLTVELAQERFTNVELFNELSVYFSDNLFNMFKLLDNKWRNLIILELQDHIGKNSNSKEVSNRNIYLGTEVEFIHLDILGDEKLYTGVVIEADYQTSTYKIDSYENVYQVEISSITKILNNTKFKHNLNKLNNIDFL